MNPDPLQLPETGDFTEFQRGYLTALRSWVDDEPLTELVVGETESRLLAFLLVALCAAGVGFLIGRIVT